MPFDFGSFGLAFVVVGSDGACRQRRSLARLRIRLGVADLDLALRGQTAVIGGEEDVERGDDVVLTRRRLVEPLALLLERDRVTPVGERDLLVRRRRHRLPEHDEIGEARHARCHPTRSRCRRSYASRLSRPTRRCRP